MSSKKLKARPDHSPASAADFKNLDKRKIRYWCFRFKTEAVDGVPAKGAPPGLKDYFEALEWFSGWADFSTKWDVRPDKPLVIRSVKEDPELAWDREVFENSRELPTKQPV